MRTHAKFSRDAKQGSNRLLKGISLLAPALAPLLLTLPTAPVFAADITLPPLSIGAGARSSFRSTDVDGAADKVNDFTLDSARLYISGSVTDTIKFTFNTEYTGDVDNEVQMMDAIGRFELSPKFNIWAGRFLPPSDRANLYGPYYANNFRVYVDGVQNGHPAIFQGRDNGLAYWGDFDRVKVSFGVFDVPSTMAASGNGEDVLVAGRLQVDFWDLEPGYYLNGTYYGEKDLLALGVSMQDVSGDSALTLDFLLEKKLSDGAVTLEAEYAKYDGLGGYNTAGIPTTESDGWYALGAYLFGQKVGIGQIQLLGKYAETDNETGFTFTQSTTELNVNYIIKSFNARLTLFYLSTDYDNAAPDVTQVGVGMQIQI